MPTLSGIFRLSSLFSFALLFLSAISHATPTPSDYGALPVTQMVAISPNGNLMAYRRVTESQDSVIISSISEKKVLFALDVSKIQPRYIYFLNDKQVLLIASEFTRVQGYLGKFDVSTGFLLNIQDKTVRQLLTPGDKISAGQMGLGNVVGTTPDGQYALMPAFSATDYVVTDTLYNLYKVDLTKNNLKLATQGGKYTKDFFVDGEGNTIAMEEFNDKTNVHKILAKHDGKWAEIFSEETDIRNKGFVGLTADFKSLVFIDRDEKSDHSSYNLMSLADGAITPSIFMRDDADISDTIQSLQRVVYGIRYSGFTPSYKFFDPALDQRVKDIVAKFPEQSVSLMSWSPDWKHIVVLVTGSSYVGDYYLFSESQPPVFLTSGRTQIKSDDLNPLGKVTFTARDGLKIPTLITVPRAKISDMKNLPAVIYPHGGPEYHDTIGFDFIAQALAAQGYLVIQPQFRGSNGFGFKLRDAGFGEWGKKMQDDVTDAVKFFAAKGIIDPQRVCIVGASYGGYAALAGGAFTPELYKCVVSINGVSDVNDMLDYDKFHTGKDSETSAYWELQLAKGEVNKEDLNKISPQKFAQQFTAPVLLIHSVNDTTVAPEQSEDMYKALQKHKKVVQQVTLAGDDHYLLKGPTRTKAVEETVKFVNQYLQPAAANTPAVK